MTTRRIIWGHTPKWLIGIILSEAVLFLLWPLGTTPSWVFRTILLLGVAGWCLELGFKKVYYQYGEFMQFIFPVPWRYRESGDRNASVRFTALEGIWKVQLSTGVSRKHLLFSPSYRKSLRIGRHWVITGKVLDDADS
jgi:hypothetical protein